MRSLLPLQWDEDITIDFAGWFCMADGKVLNEMTENPCTQRCPLCHELPSEYKGKMDCGFKMSAWEAIDNMCIGKAKSKLKNGRTD